MEIEDYIRTNDGYINKIKKVNQFNVLVEARYLFGEELNIPNNEIIKSSPNIIDLIEENDYIRTINDTDFRRVYMSYGKLVIEKHGLELSIKKLKLAEIITSQQFPQMKYKVESEVN